MLSGYSTRSKTIGLGFLFILFCSQSLFARKVTHGPIAGGVTPTAARFYLRIEAENKVNVQLSTTRNFTTIISGVEQSVTAASDFAALLRVENLTPNALYYYRAAVNGVPENDVRQFRTFPLNGTRTPFLFTFGSCQQNRPWRNSTTAGRVFTTMAADLPSFFLQIGDWGYPDTTDTARDSTDFFSVQMSRVQESYRAKFDSTYRVQQILRTTPVDYVYDDHDYLNNNASAYTANDALRAREIPAPPQARLNSIRGYLQLFPGYPLANANGGIWHKFTYGNADFFMLDTRSQRSPNMNALRRNARTGKYELAPAPNHSILAGDSTLIGENQRDWLLRELRASQADWKFIITSVPFNRGLRRAVDLTLAVQDSSAFIPGFGSVTGLFLAIELLDKWVGFPQDQETLLRFIANHKIKNVIVLSGDTHTAAIDDGANAGLPEIMAGGLDITNSRLVAVLELFGVRIWNRGGQTLMSSGFNNAYGRLNVFGTDSVRMEIVDEFGGILARHIVRDGSLPTTIDEPATTPVKTFSLSPTFPNPLQSSTSEVKTTLSYILPANALVTATVYDVLGRQVRELRREKQIRGVYTLLWDGKDERGAILPSGVYLISMRVAYADGQQQRATRKIALVK